MRQWINLFEKATVDAETHARALATYQKFATYINNGGKPDFELEIGGEGDFYGFQPETAGLEAWAPKTVIMLGLRKPHQAGIMAGAAMNFKTVLDDKYTSALIIYCLRDFTEQSIIPAVISTQFLSSFIHEFIHFFDDNRTSGKTISKGVHDASNKTKYYNDTAELNAYFHTFADNWLDCLTTVSKNPEEFAGYLSLYNITGDFPTDALHLMNQSIQSRAFFSHLKASNRKSFLRRLYKLHHELMSLGGTSKTLP